MAQAVSQSKESRLSERQRRILQFIKEYAKNKGHPPTIREIGQAAGISSTSVVKYNLDKLTELGYLHRTGEVTRGLTFSGSAPSRSAPSIFISYAREDEDKARALYGELKSRGYQPWIDKEDILPGKEWDLTIRQRLRESDFLVVCLSRKAITKRGYFQKEIRMALDIAQEMPEGSIFLIPARLEATKVPESIAMYQYVDLFNPDGFDKLIRAITEEWTRRKK
ncbi:MAG: TIR domain-containing protein [Chloroflexi bacterium]|nr:TIR domain-containing protein [Chloroflexota bacterium]